MSLYSIDKEKYNGWNNFATWKLFTEVFAGIELMNKVSAEEAREFTKLADYEELADAINETNQDNWETVAV